jgi:hypothetical protein
MDYKGGAQGRKKLTKKKTDYQYYAPRYVDGEMVDGHEYVKGREAAKNIQRRVRGKLSRNKHDMKSNWYKGGPTNPPDYSYAPELQSRVISTSIHGIDRKKHESEIDNLKDVSDRKWHADYDRDMKGKNKEKFMWGKYYSDVYPKLNQYAPESQKLTEEQLNNIISFMKKNKKKLEKIDEKRKYANDKLDEIGVYDKSKEDKTEHYKDTDLWKKFELSNKYLYNKKGFDDYMDQYYRGYYYDFDDDEIKQLDDYLIEDPPELSPIDEEELEDDVYLHPYEQVKLMKDHYSDINSKLLESDKKYQEREKVIDERAKNLEDKTDLDIIKCLEAKEMLRVDPMLYKNKSFIEEFEDCGDSEALTNIYIDTFYSMPWQLIKPASITVREASYRIPDEDAPLFSEVLDEIITDLGIFRGMQQFGYHGTEWNSTNLSLIWLSNFYRWANRGTVKIHHLAYMPRFRGEMSGKIYLYDTFYRLDEQYSYIDKSILEKVKRYFILMLMGVIGNEEIFYDNIAHLITRSIVGVVELEDKLYEYNIEKEDLLSLLQEQGRPTAHYARSATAPAWSRRWLSNEDILEEIQDFDNNIEKTLKKIELLKEKQKVFERFRLISNIQR